MTLHSVRSCSVDIHAEPSGTRPATRNGHRLPCQIRLWLPGNAGTPPPNCVVQVLTRLLAHRPCLIWTGSAPS